MFIEMKISDTSENAAIVSIVVLSTWDVDESSKGKRDFKKLNGKGVPIFLVGDQRMNGFSPKRLLAMLEAVRSD